jgi:RHS repeat-associated protein
MDNFKVSGCGAVQKTSTVTATPTITPTPRSTVETQYQYDRNGNLIRETVRQRYNPPQTTRYYYNFENRLSRVVPPTGPPVNYRYDYAGNLVERSTGGFGGGRTRYAYGAGVEPLAQQEGGQWTDNVVVNGKIIETFRRTYGNNPNNKLFCHTDALGSVVALSNRTGRIVRTTEYDPWGKVLVDNSPTGMGMGGPVSIAYEFVGGYGVRRDIDNKSIMGVRMYDAGTGRFITEDPLSCKVDLNTYRYVRNNSINSVDPSGLIPDCFMDVFWPCLSKSFFDPDIFTGGPPSIPEEVSLATLASRHSAWVYAMQKGLSHPLKSSTFRWILRLPSGAAIFLTDISIWGCFVHEMDQLSKGCCI